MRSLNPQIESIHGHEVLHLIQAAPNPLTRETLESAIIARFGTDPRFHTCAGGALTLEQLLAFLIAKSKVVEREGRLSIVAENVCGG